MLFNKYEHNYWYERNDDEYLSLDANIYPSCKDALWVPANVWLVGEIDIRNNTMSCKFSPRKY